MEQIPELTDEEIAAAMKGGPSKAVQIELDRNIPPVIRLAARAVGRHLTVVDNIYYHSHDGKNPVDVPSHFHVPLKSADERPYEREIKLGEDWVLLRDKYCWIEGPPSMVVIKNEAGTFHHLGVMPTDEQRAEEAVKVVELRADEFSAPFLLIPPENAVRFQPVDFEKLQIRCRKGNTKFTLSVFPG